MAEYYQTLAQGMQGMYGQALQQRRLADQEAQMMYMQQLRNAQLQNQMNEQRLRHQEIGQRQSLAERGADTREMIAWDAAARRDRAETARQKAEEAKERAAKMGSLKQGYQWDPSGTRQVLVPQGPAWREQASKHADDVGLFDMVKEQTIGADEKIQYLLDDKNKDAFESLFGGYNALLTQYMPGETQDARAALDSLKSSMKAAGTRLVRAGGGAIGAITEREWPILESMIDSLTPLMSETKARETLRNIQTRFTRMANSASEKYKNEWSDTPFYNPKNAEIPKPTKAQEALIWTAPDGKSYKFPTRAALEAYKRRIGAQ